MAPKNIKKKNGGVADSSTQLRDSDKNNSKSFVEKLKAVSKSNRESIALGEINKKDGNTANSTVELLQSVDKNPSLMSRPEEVSKSPSRECIHSKEAKTASEANIENENKRKRKREEKQNINSKKDAAKHLNFHQKSKEKRILDEKHEARKKTEQRSFNSIGGMIFMCNAKTKPDCFQYRVMGVSTSRQESVMQIRPGLKLFLYDFDLRLMYGIYEASSVGGMKLEPAAFAGAFPVQVRFKIHQDCIPLPEAVFKKAIKDSYNEKTHKFKTELTVEQVNRLIELFRPVPLLHSNAKSSLPELMPASIVQPPTLPSEEIHRQQVHREQYGSKLQQGSVPIDHNGRDIMHNSGPSPHPLFLTEREYRNYGLRSERQLLPINVPVSAPTSYTYERNRFDHRGEQLQNNFPSLTNNVVQKEPGRSNLLFLNEKEYRAYGLKGGRELLSGKTAAVETSHSFEDSRRDVCNPYDHRTTSLVNRYLSLPGPVAATAEPYLTGKGVPVATTVEPYSTGNGVPAATTAEPYLTGKGGYVNGSRYISEIKDHSVGLNERERMHSSYASHTLSSYNRHYHHLGDDPDLTSSTVSSRYSFGGPSLSQR